MASDTTNLVLVTIVLSVLCFGCFNPRFDGSGPESSVTPIPSGEEPVEAELRLLQNGANLFSRLGWPKMHPGYKCDFACQHLRSPEEQSFYESRLKPTLFFLISMRLLRPGCDPVLGFTANIMPSPPLTDVTIRSPEFPQKSDWVRTEVGELCFQTPAAIRSSSSHENTIVHSTEDDRYSIIVTEWKGRLYDDRFMTLETLLRLIAEQASAEIVNLRRGSFNGQPALRFGLRINDEVREDVLTVEMMTTFLDFNTLIQIAVTDGEYERFYDSVRVLEDVENDQGVFRRIYPLLVELGFEIAPVQQPEDESELMKADGEQSRVWRKVKWIPL